MPLRTLLLSFVLLLSVSGQAQVDTGLKTPVRLPLPDNGVSMQIAGNSPIISLNYHRTLLRLRQQSDQTDHGSVEMGLGLGYTLAVFQPGLVNFPHHVSVNYGSRRLRGEIGYGGTNGRRGTLFTKAGYQPGLITGIRMVLSSGISIRLFVWTTFYRDVYYVLDPQFRFNLRETQHFRVFPGVSFICHFN